MTARQEAPNYTFPVDELKRFFGVDPKGHPRVHVAQISSGISRGSNTRHVTWESSLDNDRMLVVASTGIGVEFVRHEGNIFEATIGLADNSKLHGEVQFCSIAEFPPVIGIKEVVYLTDFDRLVFDGNASIEGRLKQHADVRINLASKEIFDTRETKLDLNPSQK